MTDVWDFTELLKGWTRTTGSDEKPLREYPEVEDQMNTELTNLTTDVKLLECPAFSSRPTSRCLTPLEPLEPLEPLKGTTEGTPAKAKDTRDQNKHQNQIPGARMIKKPYNPSRIIKPKEPIQVRTKRPATVQRATRPGPIFKANPPELRVVNFTVNTEYELIFTLQNVSDTTNGFQLRAPKDAAFTFRILEESEHSLIRPGLHMTFRVIFHPQEPRDYKDKFEILPGPGKDPTIVPIKCYRDPPVLCVPDIVDMGSSFIHSHVRGTFEVVNKGGVALFSFHSATGRETETSYVDGPFSLSPGSFELAHGESIVVEVEFSPHETGDYKASFEICAQYFPVKFFFLCQGVGTAPMLKFELCDEDRLVVPFLPNDVYKTREVVIENLADVSYPYSVQVVPRGNPKTCELARLYPEFKIQNSLHGRGLPFRLSQYRGVIGKKEKITLGITFSPCIFAFFAADIIVFADEVPDANGEIVSQKMLTISAEGTSGPPSVMIQPPLMIFQGIIPRTDTTQHIDVINKSNVEIKLQWRKSIDVTPIPLMFQVPPTKTFTVDICCNLRQRASQQLPLGTSVFKHQPNLAVQYQNSGVWRFSSANLLNNEDKASGRIMADEDGGVSLVPSHASVPDFRASEGKNSLLIDADDDSSKGRPSLFTQSPGLLADDDAAHFTDEVALEVDHSDDMAFTYYATIQPPVLEANPPVIEFGSVFIGQQATQTLELINPNSCPIGFEIVYPCVDGWSIPKRKGCVIDRETVDISLTFSHQTSIDEMIKVKMYWTDKQGEPLESLPGATMDIPIYAIFDSPIIKISERIIDVGDVFPTLEYKANTEFQLINTFATDYHVIPSTKIVTISLPLDRTSSSHNLLSKKSKNCKETISTVTPENVKLIDALRANLNHEMPVEEYARAIPDKGSLVEGDKAKINFVASFCSLGDNVIPILCNISGCSYRMAIIGHVKPPKIELVTDVIDFSADFVICNRSHSHVVIRNDCGVASTVRVEMVDDCDSVFSLDNDKAHDIGPFESVNIPVSCYSEIHGDYNGTLKLIIRDPWQSKEILIPMHVKARGSFFGFLKHTLGYTEGTDRDYVSFGHPVPVGSKKVIRRLTLVNFSSEAISVELKQRLYRDLFLVYPKVSANKIKKYLMEIGEIKRTESDEYKISCEENEFTASMSSLSIPRKSGRIGRQIRALRRSVL